jgi:hypothetical protein
VAEGGGLLNRYTLSRRIEGSNPSLSASEVPGAATGMALHLHETCGSCDYSDPASVPQSNSNHQFSATDEKQG